MSACRRAEVEVCLSAAGDEGPNGITLKVAGQESASFVAGLQSQTFSFHSGEVLGVTSELWRPCAAVVAEGSQH